VTFVGVLAVIELGDAVKVASTGAIGTGVVSIVICLLSLPARLLQVSVYVVAVASVRFVVAPFAMLPMPWSSEQSGIGVGAFAYVQVHVTGVALPTTTVAGVATSVASDGATGAGTTVIVVSAVASPPPFVQCSVNVVSALLVMIDCESGVTGPTPSISHDGAGLGMFANENDHVTGVGTPVTTDDGDAVNDSSCGATSAAPPPHAASTTASPNHARPMVALCPAGQEGVQYRSPA
jgi:hypothetical protein